MKTLLVVVALLSLFRFAPASAADITVRLQNPPPEGDLVIQVYDNADAFGDFRRPAREMRFAIQPGEPGEAYVIPDAPAGQVAVLAYVDENKNRALDRSFIGIPREPLGLSNNYQPKGPPSFQRASFPVAEGQANYVDIELYSVLGDAGQWGVGLGAVGRSSPYVGSDTNVVQVIPAITYFGERLQWVGPNLRYGIAGSDRLRLAVTASYRVGAYEEDDSPNLEGLGDRDSTVMLGLGVIYEGPYGIELDFGYQNDVLDNVGGGGIAAASVSRGFQFGNIRLNPALGVNWTSSSVADYDFGVPQSAALPGRPAYDVGSSITVEAGVGALWELTENWRVALNVAWENLDSEITDSPIVDEDYVIKGFTAITYTF